MNEEGVLHFEAAINPYGCSPKVSEALEAFARAREFRFYGDATALELREELAALHDLSPDNFVVYNGAGEALAWLFVFHLVMRRGRLIVPYPSYERFVEAGRRCAAELIEVPLDDEDFSLSVERLIEEGNQRGATLGLISNPNNPSGNSLLDEAGLKRLLDELPECLWIIDEAYADYTGKSFVPLVRERPNLVVLRTFSKAYGLAGLRVGCAVAQREVALSLSRSRLPWAVNSMSLIAARAALRDQDYLREVVARIRQDCAELYTALDRLPHLEVSPSAANFFLVRLKGVDAQLLKDHLQARRIRVRSRPDMPEHIRITSLRPEENRLLLGELHDYLSNTAR
ncbi:MAG TPA: histidinol-phosphate transaminase [Pyrinomonadaceae bacterium]|jgi:histidinol-phosphate aminotransferase|nr:histidinol-phosphate transaminase [Pyrinomonadaceae bacterium]